MMTVTYFILFITQMKQAYVHLFVSLSLVSDVQVWYYHSFSASYKWFCVELADTTLLQQGLIVLDIIIYKRIGSRNRMGTDFNTIKT